MLDANEKAAVAWALVARPVVWDGIARKANQLFSTWLANCAYWKAYPERPKQIDPKQQLHVDDWLEMHAEIQARLLEEAPPVYNASKPRWPLVSPPQKWGAGGTFEARRPWKKSLPHTRFHCGVDLDADLGDPVLAPESATVAAVDVGWEKPTVCVLLHLDSGNTLLLGGVKKTGMPSAGTRVAQGQRVAEVTAYPGGSTMLHVQLYSGHLSRAQVQGQMAWYVNSPRPANLLDPRDYLDAAAGNTPVGSENAAFASFGVSVGDPGYEVEVLEGTPEETGESPPANNGGAVVPAPPPAVGGVSPAAVLGGGLAVVGVGVALYRASRR